MNFHEKNELEQGFFSAKNILNLCAKKALSRLLKGFSVNVFEIICRQFPSELTSIQGNYAF